MDDDTIPFPTALMAICAAVGFGWIALTLMAAFAA